MRVIHSEGSAFVTRVFSTPAPFEDGVVRTPSEARTIRYTNAAVALGMHQSPVVVACSPRMKESDDSHGKFGRKLHKTKRGNLRWSLI